jgi:hypothetical protein
MIDYVGSDEQLLDHGVDAILVHAAIAIALRQHYGGFADEHHCIVLTNPVVHDRRPILQ